MTGTKKNYLVLLISLAFSYFAFGAITNVAGAIVPKIKETYSVSATASTLLASVFFIAYGLTSLPFGVLINKKGSKFTLVLGAIITGLGVVMFAGVPGYFSNMFAMFLCGIGITAIQVAANPLVKEISNPEKYSRNLTMFMVINGIGSSSAPYVVTLIKNSGYSWNYTYWLFSIISLVMILALLFSKYPEVKKSEETQKSSSIGFKDFLKDPLVIMFSLAIFLYVGVEVGIANNISLFLEDTHRISEKLGEGAEAAKNSAIGNYWFGLLIGRLIGSFVLDKLDARRAIQIYITGAGIALGVAVFSNDLNITLWSFPAIGFFISIMFPSIYGMAIDAYKKEYASIISGILCTAIIGGAVIAPLIAKISEMTGTPNNPNWKAGMILAFVCYAYIFSVGVWGKNKPCNPELSA